GRHGADAAGFAGALDAERVGLGWHRAALDVIADQIARPRHGVVHERAGEHLALLVELDVFHEDLADAHGDAAVDLAVKEQRIDHRADVVDYVVAQDFDLAGLLVDFQLADVAAVRIARHLAGVDRLLDQ